MKSDSTVKYEGVEEMELVEAINGGCLEIDATRVTSDEALDAEDAFLREKIRRAEEWGGERGGGGRK